MEQQPFWHSKYFDETFFHPVGGAALIVLCVILLTVPRRLAIFPFLVLICFIPCSQRIAIAGLDFNFLRILILCGWLRVIARGELRTVKWLKLDRIVLAWGIVEALAYITLHHNSAAVVHMSGRMLESLGGYFLVRGLVQSWGDLRRIAQVAALISIPVAICFAIEKSTGRNFFSVFGGVREFTMVREGKLRAAGALGNPILAGCFWAALAPYIGALWWTRNGKPLAFVGILCSLVVIFACASSTPIAAFAAGVMGAFLYMFRHQMNSIRWAVVGTMCGMQLMMSRPIWHLMTRIDLVGGSTGWHRFQLIDQWVKRVPEWAPLGVKYTAHWGHGLEDVTNQYILESVRGGMGAFVLFVAMIVVAFGYVGRLWRAVEGNRELSPLAWSVGVALFVHCASFMAVAYFAQVVFGWSLSLALTAGLVSGLSSKRVNVVASPVPVRHFRPRLRRQRRLLGQLS